MLDARTRRRQRWRNQVHGLVLIGCMIALFAALAWLVLGAAGLWWILGLGIAVLVVRPRVPVGWALAMYGAQPLPEYVAPELHAYLRELSRRAGLARPPALFYLPTRLTNAFSVGSGERAALAVSDGLLRQLSERQVVAVLAHEISHVRAGDTTVMTLADALGRLVHLLSWVGIASVLLAIPMADTGNLRLLEVAIVLIAMPTLFTLLQLAWSRSREYEADVNGASLTGDPEGLASALMSLEQKHGRLWERLMVSRTRVPDALLLRTHPPTEERVRRLMALVPRPADSGPRDDRFLHPRSYPAVSEPPRRRLHGARW